MKSDQSSMSRISSRVLSSSPFCLAWRGSKQKRTLSHLNIALLPCSLAFHSPCTPSYMRSGLTRCWPSTVTAITAIVVKIDASAVDAEIMNVIIICNIAACWTEEPPRMAPVIMPGIAMIPITLTEDVLRLAKWCVYCNLWGFNSAPHLVYHGGKRHQKCSFRDGSTCFQSGRAESQVHLNLVPVFPVLWSEMP